MGKNGEQQVQEEILPLYSPALSASNRKRKGNGRKSLMTEECTRLQSKERRQTSIVTLLERLLERSCFLTPRCVKIKNMPIITVETEIYASVERCFDAARDIGLHCHTVAQTGERAVSGVTSGLIGLGSPSLLRAFILGFVNSSRLKSQSLRGQRIL